MVEDKLESVNAGLGAMMGFERILKAKWEGLGPKHLSKNHCFFGSVFGRLQDAPGELQPSSGRAPATVLSAAEAPRERRYHKDQRRILTIYRHTDLSI